MVEFRILGPLEASGDRGAIDLGGPRQRSVLAVLLCAANRVVPFDMVVDAIWGERPPRTARRQVQNQVSALRQAFAEAGAALPVTTRPAGYVLAAGTDQLDGALFEREVDECHRHWAAGRVEGTADVARTALRRWRGPALAGIVGPGPADEAARLEELRLDLLALRIDADLARGRHHDLTGELTALVRAHPLRERFRGQLMTTLYRSGRKVDALATYDTARRMLAREFGLDPGPELAALRQAILTDCPSDPANPTGHRSVTPSYSTTGPGHHLAAPSDHRTPPSDHPAPPSDHAAGLADHPATDHAAVLADRRNVADHAVATDGRGVAGAGGTGPGGHGAASDGGSATGDEAAHTGRDVATVLPRAAGRPGGPAELPPRQPDLVGRGAEHDQLLATLAAGRTVVLVGPPGAGTSALAAEAAWAVADRYPDGQIRLGLRTIDGSPTGPADALAHALASLGVPAGDVPPGTDARSGLYRTLLADQRILVLVDDADSAEQVRPLLTTGTGCTTIVAGTSRLDALEGARPVRVGPLAEEDAVELLRTVAGPAARPGRAAAPRIRLADAAPDDTACRIVRGCRCLPGPVHAAGAWLARFPEAGLDTLAALLADDRRRLAVLALADPRVRVRLRHRYERLGAPAREVFRLLASGPGTVDPARLAHRLGRDPVALQELLDEAVDADLVELVADAAGRVRYRLVGLSRCLARELAEAGGTPSPGDRSFAPVRPA